MKTKFPFEVNEVSASCFALTDEQAALIFTPAQLAAGERLGDIETRGPWDILSKFSALATAQDLSQPGGPLKIYGTRSLSRPKQVSYALEGAVSIARHRYRGFTSSALFQLADGRLLNCCIIHVCLDQPK